MTSRLRTLLGCAALLLASAFTAGVASAQTQVTLTMPGCASLTAPSTQGSTFTVTCNPNVAPPGSPSCSIPTITGVPAAAPTSLTFQGTCTKGTNPITSVTAAGVAQTPVNPTGTYTVTGISIPTVNTTYTITASDGTNSDSKSTVYVVSGGGGGAVDLSGCTALGYPNSGYYDAVYPTVQNLNVSNVFHAGIPGGPFGNSSALVVRFTTPSLGVNDGTQPNFQTWTGSSTGRQMTIGTAPCLVPTVNSNLPADWAHASLAGVLKTVLSSTPTMTPVITADGLCAPSLYNCTNTGNLFLRPNTT